MELTGSGVRVEDGMGVVVWRGVGVGGDSVSELSLSLSWSLTGRRLPPRWLVVSSTLTSDFLPAGAWEHVL